MTQKADGCLERVLAEAQRRSLIGQLPLIRSRSRIPRAFSGRLSESPSMAPHSSSGPAVGLPGLVVAVLGPDLHLVLLDSSRRSTDFLRWAVDGARPVVAGRGCYRSSGRSRAGPSVTGEVRGRPGEKLRTASGDG